MSIIKKLNFQILKTEIEIKVNEARNYSQIEQCNRKKDYTNTLVKSTLKTYYAWVRKTLWDLLSEIFKRVLELVALFLKAKS